MDLYNHSPQPDSQSTLSAVDRGDADIRALRAEIADLKSLVTRSRSGSVSGTPTSHRRHSGTDLDSAGICFYHLIIALGQNLGSAVLRVPSPLLPRQTILPGSSGRYSSWLICS